MSLSPGKIREAKRKIIYRPFEHYILDFENNSTGVTEILSRKYHKEGLVPSKKCRLCIRLIINNGNA